MIDALGYFIYNLLVFIWPIVLLYFLARLSWLLWVHYVQQTFIAGIDWVLLEIIPPREVLRSPRAMELFFTNALYHQSEKGLVEKYWQGAIWFWFSLEIVSIDGQVHFYVRTPTRLKEFIETNMYAQYPQSQVKVVDDYTLAVDEISSKSDWNLWGCEFILEKPSAYPIKTYVDFELDKNPKEEQKVDPLAPVIELFGSLLKGEQMWLQIVIRFAPDSWLEEAQKTLEEILIPYSKISPRENMPDLAEIRPPDTLKPVVEGITRKRMKLGFETGIRVCYVAKKSVWREDNRRNIRLIFRQYATPFLNSFVRTNSTQFDYPWQFTKNSLLAYKNRMLGEYRERSYFSDPLRKKIPIIWPMSMFVPKWIYSSTFVLNTEELATIFHFPGQILKMPTLERVESKEAAPPTNLPM
jgi:hypothetical protein